MNIKKLLFPFFVLLLSIVLLCSCSEDTPKTPEKTYYTVTYDRNNGEESITLQLASGSVVPRPDNPVRDGFIFDGWKYNGKEWDFTDTIILKDTTLIATWIDASSVFSYTVNEDDTITITEYSGGLSALRIPEFISGKRVSGIADEVFLELDKEGLLEITLPPSVSSVGNGSFYNCGGVPIIIDGKLSSLGEASFYRCDKLTAITLASGLDKIPYNSFAGCSSLETITIPAGVTVIEENAFADCSSMQTIVIETTDAVVENSAFSNCNSLKTVFFMGNAEQWNDISEKVDNGGNSNSALLLARVYFYCESEPEDEGNYWYMNEKNQPRCW